MQLSKADLERRILVELDGLLVIDKPADLPSTGRSLDDEDCLQFALMQRAGQMVWAVHQLDAHTTGLNLFVDAKHLVAKWKARLVFPHAKKSYLALVHGAVDFATKRVESPIGVISETPTRQLGITPQGKRAVSEVRRIESAQQHSLVQVDIETGRTHQIRIHLAALGHPLVGDDWYGAPGPRAHPRQALHAWRIAFEDGPLFECPLAPDLCDLLGSLDIQVPR